MNKNYQKECESSVEYALPDYMGDVKKVLSVSAAAVPSGKFFDEGAVMFSGIVSYDVIYCDAEGKLTKLVATSDYDVKHQTDSDTYVDSMAEPKLSNVSVRVTGPRKVVLKSTVSNIIKVISDDDVTPSGNAFEADMPMEAVSTAIKTENLSFFSSSEREYAEEAEKLIGVIADDIDVISTSGSVNILESIPTDDGILVRGEITITSIIRTEEQPPFAIKKTIPFEQTVTLEGGEGRLESVAHGYLTSVTTGVADDEDGARVTASAVLELVGMVSHNDDVTVMSDAYLQNRDTVGEYEDFYYDELVAMGNTDVKVQSTLMRADIGCEEMRDILSLSAEVRSCEAKPMPRGVELSGELGFSGVACAINDDTTPNYIPLKFTAPFKANVNLDCQIPENSNVDFKLYPGNVDAVLDADTITLKTSLGGEYHITRPGSVRRMTSCNVYGEKEYSPKLSEIKVYYPEAEETLFDVAKKFHTTCAKIAEDNKLSAEVSSFDNAALSVKKLIIR